MGKKEIRAAFRRAVFSRDTYSCRCCGKPGKDHNAPDGGDWPTFHWNIKDDSVLVPLDAHHICDRNEMPNGGYVKENGISVCPDCHLKCEEFWQTGTAPEGFMPEDLYKRVGSTKEKAVRASERLGS